MEKDYLVLKRASASRPSGEWDDDDFDVLADDTWLCRDTRGCDVGIRQELAAGMKHKGTNIMIGGLPGHDD
jgi:hypothetical protein